MESGAFIVIIITVITYVILYGLAWFTVRKASKVKQQMAMLKEIIEKQDKIISELQDIKRK